MSNYYGDFATSKVVRVRFNTVASSGAPASLASGAVIVSKDGADVTPTGGVTLTADVGSVVGRNHVIIDMSVDTATFTAASEYAVRLSGSSNVGGTSVVGIIVGEWSVVNRSTPTVANIVAAILVTPSNKLATDASGNVTASNAGVITADAGTVSASPTPTTTTFTATGSGLHAPTGGYTVNPMAIYWTSGTNQGVKYAISAHVVASTNHTFTVTAMPSAPAAGDTFIIV